MPPRPEIDEPSLYDPPPRPPGLSEADAYMAEVYAHGVRHQEASAQGRHRELLRVLGRGGERGPGLSGWLSATLGRLPASVQSGMVLGVFWLLTQLGGALYEHLTGRAPPQPSQPTYPSQLSPAAAASTPPEAP